MSDYFGNPTRPPFRAYVPPTKDSMFTMAAPEIPADIVEVLTDEYPRRRGIVLDAIGVGVLVEFHNGDKAWFEQGNLLNLTTGTARPTPQEMVSDGRIGRERGTGDWSAAPDLSSTPDSIFR